ncbi:major facilitator superfamily domain-containing protein [Gautieria morchelliformis]|nr:major facilitator superfamily domain-containing protein [Gautieria morchelliformis]
MNINSLLPVRPTSEEEQDVEKTVTLTEHDEDDIYDRFSRGRKRAIVAVITFAALLAPFASSSFLPSIPQISSELRVSQAVINYTVAVYLIVIGVAPLGWSPYSTYCKYGRQRIYLTSLPIFVAGSVGVAESNSLVALILARTVQGAGASSVLAVGAGSIGDIYRPTERGRAMGAFYAVGATPTDSSRIHSYARGNRGSWRAFQYLLAAMGTCSFLSILFFLPETSHSRRADSLSASQPGEDKTPQSRKQWGWVWLNPLRPLALLKYRNVLAISMTSSFVLLTTYCLLVPLTYTLGPRYGIENEAILGTLYLAPGFGNIVGSRVSGYVSDATVARWIKRRSNEFVPEDRLRAALVSGALTPLTLLGVGFTMQFWTSTGGLAMSLVLLFLNGVGLMGILAVCNTYLVDVMQDRSAEVIATNNCLRYIASAGASAAVLPIIQKIGIAATNAIATGFSVTGFALMCATIKYGKSWREVSHSRV